MRLSFCSSLLGVLLFAAPLATAVANPPPLYAVEDFFKDTEFERPVLSPDGKHLAVLRTINGRKNIVVYNIDDRRSWSVTNLSDKDVLNVRWMNRDILRFRITTDEGAEGGFDIGFLISEFFVRLDGSRTWQAAPQTPSGGGRAFYGILHDLPDEPHHVLISHRGRDRFSPDVFRMDIRNGRTQIVVRNPDWISDWIADHDGKVRLGVGTTLERDRNWIIWRAREEDEWTTIAEFRRGERRWMPIAFDEDNRQLLVASNLDADTTGLFSYDPETRQMGEVIYRDSRYDIHRSSTMDLAPDDFLHFRGADAKLMGFTVENERSVAVWINREMAAWQQSIDAEIPGELHRVISSDSNFRRHLIAHYSDRQPTRLSLLDLDARALMPLFVSRPNLNPEHMSEMRPVTFRARDGLPISGYLTLPNGRGESQLPLIIHPHGGPWSRDRWGFNGEIQFLANRGFAVLQVDFRGSIGYGYQHLMKSRHQIGLAMQDDLTDAVRWAIAEGIADPSRIGIYGASYGGYATMAGLVYTPELYAFGINYVGVVDLVDQINSYRYPRRFEGGYQHWVYWAGDPDTDSERLKQTSPANYVERIKVPLMVVAGVRDGAVLIRQHEILTRALKSKRIPFTEIVRGYEGHGFGYEHNRLDLYSQIDTFLAPFRAPVGASD